MCSGKHWEHLRFENSIVEEALCGLIRRPSRELACWGTKCAEKTHLSFKSFQLWEEAFPWLGPLSNANNVFASPHSHWGWETVPILRAAGFGVHVLPTQIHWVNGDWSLAETGDSQRIRNFRINSLYEAVWWNQQAWNIWLIELFLDYLLVGFKVFMWLIEHCNMQRGLGEAGFGEKRGLILPTSTSRL